MDEVAGYQVLQNELDSYVAFYKRRTEIEQEYAESLLKLAYKQPGEARKPEDETKLGSETTWRRAWGEMKTSVTDEAVTHRKLAEDFRKVLADLTSFRDDKDRMRRRVKDDVKVAQTEHQAYLSDVGKLRKTYERRVEEVQAHEEAESAREHEGWPPGHWSDSEGSGRARSHSTASSKGDRDRDSSPPPIHSPPLVSPPAHFVSGATSTGASSNAYRDAPPSGKPANVFDAIAKRDWSGEKRGIHKFMGAVRDRVGEGQGQLKPSAARGAKARQVSSKLKREAEQADRDYRNAIFRLETLRLQRNRLNRSAVQSLHEFAGELSAKLKAALISSIDNRARAGAERVHIAQDFVPKVRLINPVADEDTFKAQLRNAAPPEAKVYYNNYFVGECRTLLFGVSLTDYLATHPDRPVPLIVQNCIRQIEETGLDCEGIYRIPGKLATVQQIVHAIEKNEEAFQFDAREEPATVAGVLKLYLRQLPFPLFQWPSADRIAFSAEYGKNSDADLSSIARRIRRLAPAHQATLKALCVHLAHVAAHEAANKMNPMNLGLCFTPVVLGEDEAATLESAMHSGKDIVMELLITHHALLFDDSKRNSGRVSETPLAPSADITPPTLPRRPEQLPPPEIAPEIPPCPEQPPPSESAPALDPRPGQTPSAFPPHAQASPPQRISDIEAHPPPLPPVLPSPKAKQQEFPQALSPIAPVPVSPIDSSLFVPEPQTPASAHSNDSVYALYHHATNSEMVDSIPGPPHLGTPSPPLSAAEGRRIATEGVPGHDRNASEATAIVAGARSSWESVPSEQRAPAA